MAIWAVSVKIYIEADNRNEAGEKAEEAIRPLDGEVVSVPQKPEAEA